MLRDIKFCQNHQIRQIGISMAQDWEDIMINLPQNDKLDVRILEKVLSDQYITLWGNYQLGPGGAGVA